MTHDELGLNGLEKKDKELLRERFEPQSSWATYRVVGKDFEDDESRFDNEPDEKTRLILREIQLQGALTRRFLAQELARLSPAEE